MEKVKKFTKNKKSNKPELYVFVDSETYNVPGGVRPYFIGYNTHLEKETGKVFFDGLEEGFEDNVGTKFCSDLALWNQNYKIILVGFNIIFDLLAIYPTILKPLAGSDLELLTTAENKKLISSHFKCDTFECSVVDLWLWDTTMSVEKWRQKLGMSAKGSIDYKKRDKVTRVGDRVHYINEKGLQSSTSYQDEENYLRGDVACLIHIMESIDATKNLCTKLLSIPKIIAQCPTISSFVKCILNNCMIDSYGLEAGAKIFEETFRPIVELETYDKMQRSSSGGYTAHNKDLLVVNDVTIDTLDINSSYPHILHGLIPYGDFLDEKPDGTFVTWYVCVMTECCFIEKYACISKLLTPKKWLCGEEFYCDVELYKRIQKVHISDIKILRVVYQKSEKILTEIIDVLFACKNATKDPAEKGMVKLTLNGQYGKMLERTHLQMRVYDGTDHVLRWSNEYKAEKKLKKQNYLNNNDSPEEKARKFHEEVIKNTKPHRSCMTGVFVVHRAKCRLIDAITSEIDQGNIFLYCDTDSIKFIANKPHIQDEHPDRLGAWKHEGTYTHYRCMGKDKKYYLYNQMTQTTQIKMSGVNNRAVAFMKKHMSFKQWSDLFDVNNNFCIFDGKTTKVHKSKLDFGQIKLESVNFEINSKLGRITHGVSLDFANDKLIISES